MLSSADKERRRRTDAEFKRNEWRRIHKQIGPAQTLNWGESGKRERVEHVRATPEWEERKQTKRTQNELERYPFLAVDDFVYEPLPVPEADLVISDARVRDLLPMFDAQTTDAVWSGRVEDTDQLLIWWKYWRGVESGKIQRPLPKSRRPIPLPSLVTDG